MNLPNKLTMMRVVLVPVFMIFAAVSHYGTADFHAAYMLIAGVIFAIASITDFLDGYLARKNHLVTDFGKFMDPLADKCLTTAAFIYMVTDHVCSPIVLAVILFREFAVAGVRMLAAETGTVIAANMWGKVKTVLQMLTSSTTLSVRWPGPRMLALSALLPLCSAGSAARRPCSPAASTCGRTASCSCRRSNSRRAVGAGHARPAALPYMPFYIRCRAGHVRPLQGNGPNKETPTCQSSISVHF